MTSGAASERTSVWFAAVRTSYGTNALAMMLVNYSTSR